MHADRRPCRATARAAHPLRHRTPHQPGARGSLRRTSCSLQRDPHGIPCCSSLAPSPAMLRMQQQPSSATAAAAAASQYFLARAAAAGAAGILRTDRENLAELEHKLMEARQRFQVLKEEKCNASSKGCGCGCCPHGFVQARDQKATSVGPDSRSVSETSNLPVKKSGGRQHLTRSVKSLSSQDTMTGAEHGSPNSEGLLLAVDKFLSMK